MYSIFRPPNHDVVCSVAGTLSDVYAGRVEADPVLADKGYDANHVLEYRAQRCIPAVITSKGNRVEQRDYDRHVSKDRHLVERFFCRLKQFHRIATRYEKLARNVLDMLSLTCAYIWLVQLLTHPSAAALF
jgi:transposase